MAECRLERSGIAFVTVLKLYPIGSALTERERSRTMSDLISRQAAIKVINAVFPVDPMKSEYAQGIACGAALAKTYVEQLPTAQPEIIRCKDCKHYLDGGCGNFDSQSPSKKLMGVKPDWFCADGERKSQ